MLGVLSTGELPESVCPPKRTLGRRCKETSATFVSFSNGISRARTQSQQESFLADRFVRGKNVFSSPYVTGRRRQKSRCTGGYSCQVSTRRPYARRFQTWKRIEIHYFLFHRIFSHLSWVSTYKPSCALERRNTCFIGLWLLSMASLYGCEF